MTTIRTAWTVSVGDELLTGESLDTHGRTIAGRLAAMGVGVVGHAVVGDDRRALAARIRTALAEADLLIVTGGLGPTLDDITREALADAIETPWEEDPAGVEHVERWFRSTGREMPPGNRRQAFRPRGSRLLHNAQGTAPGILGTAGDAAYVALPGPPREMQPMLEDALAVLLPDARPRPTRLVRAFGIGESTAAARIESLMERTRELPVATTVSDSIVTARIRGTSAADETAVEALAEEVRRAWSPYAFDDGATGLAAVVGTRCESLGLAVATAESCTGGLLGGELTAVPGSSGWYRGGVVAYENRRKIEDLDVPARLVESFGAVSAEVAGAMADGVRTRTGAELGISTTGVAGPGGGTEEKPVGTVWIGVSDDRGTVTRCFRFSGDRALIRRRTVLAAMQIVRFRLDDVEAPLLWEYSA